MDKTTEIAIAMSTKNLGILKS